MKKLTILLATIATLFSVSLFTSCSEPESSEPSIVGTWVYEESVEDWTEKITFVFNADGSGSMTHQVIEGVTSYQESVSFEYVYLADAATLNLIVESYDSEIAEDLLYCTRIEAQITSNKLMLRFWYGEEGVDGGVILTRVK